jgi:hypothetical protein
LAAKIIKTAKDAERCPQIAPINADEDKKHLGKSICENQRNLRINALPIASC